MIHAIPGDPVRTALGGITAQPELVAARRHDLGLDQPLPEQYVDYLRNTVTGDFGTSIITSQPVSDIISDRLPATLRLVGLAFVFTIVVAYPLGLGMAILTQNGRHRRTEVGFAGVTGFVQAIPDFVLATALVALFGVTFQILPGRHETGPSSYVLPVLSLTLGSVAVLSRVIRLEGLRVLGEDYMRTARSKRLPGPHRLRPPRPAEHADGVADDQRAVPRRPRRRHRARRERVRLAGDRQHRRQVGDRPRLSDRLGAQPAARGDHACSSTWSSTCSSPSSTRARSSASN